MAIKVLDRLTDKQRNELQNGVIQVEGKAMNRTALGIVDAVLRLYPDVTFDELKQLLPDTINPSAPKNFRSLFKPHTDRMYGVIQPGSIRRECEENGLDINASHFIGDGETFRTKDGTEVLVSKIWETADTETKEHDLQNLIDHVAPLGVRVVSFESRKPFKRGEYIIEVINPVLLAEIQGKSPKAEVPTTSKKPSLKPIWLVIILVLVVMFLLWWFLGRSSEEQPKQEPTQPEISAKVEPIAETEVASFNELKEQIQSGNNTEGQSVSFHEILFEFNSDIILPESEVYLNEVVDVLNEIPALSLEVVGHTSSEGSDEYNLELSEKRAVAVLRYLLSKNIDPARISTSGKGSSEPVSTNDDEEGRALNRRIEFVVTNDGV